jgi:hypothetical protein
MDGKEEDAYEPYSVIVHTTCSHKMMLKAIFFDSGVDALATCTP